MEQRQIKFRGWNGEKMFRQHEASFSVYEDVMYCLNHNENIVVESIKTGHVFMQFTGLLDKNGKEIYEGDILEGDPEMPGGDRYQVKFMEASFWFWYNDENRFTYEWAIKNKCWGEPEITGNIYENPELL